MWLGEEEPSIEWNLANVLVWVCSLVAKVVDLYLSVFSLSHIQDSVVV